MKKVEIHIPVDLCEKNYIDIYEITPAPWGDDYRRVDSFDTIEDAFKVLRCLESVNINFNLYVIYVWNNLTGVSEKFYIKDIPKE